MLFTKSIVLAASIAGAAAGVIAPFSPRDVELLDTRDVCPCDPANGIVVVYPILIDSFFVINETIGNGEFTFAISNAPISISTVITGTSTSTVLATATAVTTSLPTINPATPFILQLTGNNLKRQSSSFVGSAGNAASSCQDAAVFQISSTGQLTSNGLSLSTNPGTTTQPFALSANVGSISTGFSVVDNVLQWLSSDFQGGEALFCFQGSTLFVVFDGVFPAGCSQQNLIYFPASSCPGLSTTTQAPPLSTGNNFPTTGGFQNTTFNAGTPTQAPSNPASQSAAVTPTSSSIATDPTFIEQMLFWHNTYRANNQAPPLVWNDTLATFAQSHSETCIFEHTGGPFGENLAEGTFENYSLYVFMWYNEQNNYNFDNPDLSTFESWGHFTQLVWENTQQVGCGFATTAMRCQFNYLTCEYSPPGNFLDDADLAANVKRPLATGSAIPTPRMF